jgi:hypothetical protein
MAPKRYIGACDGHLDKAWYQTRLGWNEVLSNASLPLIAFERGSLVPRLAL